MIGKTWRAEIMPTPIDDVVRVEVHVDTASMAWHCSHAAIDGQIANLRYVLFMFLMEREFREIRARIGDEIRAVFARGFPAISRPIEALDLEATG